MLKKEEKRDDDVCVYNGIVAGVVGMLRIVVVVAVLEWYVRR